jgi:hypothetical protein
MNDCNVCPKQKKEICMTVKAQADTQIGLIWIPKCEWNALKLLPEFTN